VVKRRRIGWEDVVFYTVMAVAMLYFAGHVVAAVLR
jgi:cell division protein FtsL